jgi:hypothetical protein
MEFKISKDNRDSFDKKIFKDIVVPELYCSIRHINNIQIAQDNTGTTICYQFLCTAPWKL